MVKLQENGAISAWTTDHLDALPLEGAVRPRHTPTAIGQQIEREDRAFNERRNASPQWRTPEILVKQTEGGFAFVVGK